MNLAQLQQCFQAHVLRGDRAIEQQIAGDERFATALRLGVYSQGYAVRLVEVLGESFPAVQVALGPQRFAHLVSDFARERPSRSRSARAYGAELPQWFAAKLSGPRASGLADLARFEWATAASFDAPDQTSLKAEDLASIDPTQWPRLQFTFTPTLRHLTVSSNCVAWWKFACAEQRRPSRWRLTCAQHWLLWRQELAVYYRRLSQAEARTLDAALAGRTFGQLCEQLSGPVAAARLLRGWISAGLISGASAPDAT
jgi:Putative DNA-binding domain